MKQQDIDAIRAMYAKAKDDPEAWANELTQWIVKVAIDPLKQALAEEDTSLAARHAEYLNHISVALLFALLELDPHPDLRAALDRILTGKWSEEEREIAEKSFRDYDEEFGPLPDNADDVAKGIQDVIDHVSRGGKNDA